ncbi:unnamed protein product [Rodentolepis nana]|uniref:Cap-specific mRNA (nucleoside-2'-O-)-methyltransferase 1 n=1 Tax=Rodentolepis nana TaxID=102285 RepID=A0A3P7VY94_RODNA|nr:unnamed protein product [Rodentolepis nana]
MPVLLRSQLTDSKSRFSKKATYLSVELIKLYINEAFERSVALAKKSDRNTMAQEDGDRNLLMILIDLTPVWWGTFAHEFLILPTFIENILAFASSHLALSPLNEVAIVGVTPEKTEFLWPSLNPIDKIECRNGQYEPFSIIGQTVRNKVNQMVMSCDSTSCTVSFANAINNALCFFIRRCREMRPTFAYTRVDSNTVVEDDIHNLLKDNFHARILVVRAAEDDSSQYLSLMNAVFTAQKMGVLIDACIIPPTRMSYSIEDHLRQSSTTLQESGHSSLFQQAAELTGGIYLRIPRPAGLLQYLLCVFLPHAGLRSQMILPDSNGGSSAGVDFRSACFCHRKMVDLAYVCSVCLSVFCEFSPVCSTCQTPFRIPTSIDDTQVGSKGWDLMRKLGWTDGKGLGAQGQGRLEPISTKVPKNRQGLGADAVAGFRALDIGELPNGPNAWSDDKTDLPPASANDDLCYRFSRWFPPRSNFEIPDLPERCLEALKSAILPLHSESARGPPVDSMESQSRYCSEPLLFEMLFYKNSLDKRSREAIMSARLRSNPYEDIRSGIFMNRAAMKMANMDVLFSGIFSANPPHGEILHFADICAGPGGFSEYLTWRRGCPLSSKLPHFQPIRGYGMTLRGDCDFKLRKFVAGPVENFRPYYGAADDGDITKWCNLASFAKTIVSATDGKGVHLVMADGGFDVSDGYNLQEVLSKHIYLCQCLCALTILRPGGRFITKLFDTFTDFTVDLLWLMSHVFKKIYIVKPITSRPANSERYLVCDGLISPNDCMAGCPSPPESSNKSKKQEPAETFARRQFKQKKIRKPMVMPSQSSSDNHEDEFHVDTTSAVGILIAHFLAAGEELHKLAGNDSLDLLRLAKDDVLHRKDFDIPENFPEYITKVNELLIKRQSLYLSKMIVFTDDATKSDDSQSEIAKACLEKWQVPNIKRGIHSWPLWPENISPALREIIPDPSNFTKGSLPKHLQRSKIIEALKMADLERLQFKAASFYAFVISGLHSVTMEQTSDPMILLSQGNDRIFTWEEGRFLRLESKIQLPAGCLLWAINVNIYSNKGRRYRALMVLDAAFIYGIDIQHLSLAERVAHIKVLCDTLDFPETEGTKVIYPPSGPLITMPEFINGLKELPCKDYPNGHVMFQATKSGMTCAPKGLLLVRPFSAPWTMGVSRSTGKVYYSNADHQTSTYEVPSDICLPFSKTKFYLVPWTPEHDGDLDVKQFLMWLRMLPQ